jgi:hypothetical protein
MPAAFWDTAQGILQQFAVDSPGRVSPNLSLMHTGRDSDGAQHTRIIDETCGECADRRATVTRARTEDTESHSTSNSVVRQHAFDFTRRKFPPLWGMV